MESGSPSTYNRVYKRRNSVKRYLSIIGIN